MKRFFFYVQPVDDYVVGVNAENPDDAYEAVTHWCQLRGDATDKYWKIKEWFPASMWGDEPPVVDFEADPI
jgi:hypothetical protein